MEAWMVAKVVARGFAASRALSRTAESTPVALSRA
jgi:hypothetical protein